MKIEKNKILKFLISIIISFSISLRMLLSVQNISYVFCLEAFVLFVFFINIIINVKDRFFPISFLLVSVFLGFLDLIFVVCDLRIVTDKYSIQIYEKSLLLFIVWIFFFMIAYLYKEKKNDKMTFRGTEIINNIISSININHVIVLSLIIQFFIAFKIIKTVRIVGGINNAMNDFAVFKYDQHYFLILSFYLSIIL